MKIVVGVQGVISAAFEDDEKTKIVVRGEGIDSTNLTVKLRKKVGYTEILSVAAVEEKKEEKKEEKTEEKKAETKVEVLPINQYPPPPLYVYDGHDQHQDNCLIM
ncbi:hypothetical protein ACHQM5_012607 [Ranunculus cassubicifolius]